MTIFESLMAFLSDNIEDIYYDPDNPDIGNIFAPRLPPEPDIAVSIEPTGGPEDRQAQENNTSVRILTRGDRNVLTAYNIADRISRELQAFTSGYWPGGVWVDFITTNNQRPVYRDQDENGRHIFTHNFDINAQ